jgi:hypothetical protein
MTNNNDEHTNFKTCHLSMRKAIRMFCWQCMGYKTNDVALCDVVRCPLWPWRLRTKPEPHSQIVGAQVAATIMRQPSKVAPFEAGMNERQLGVGTPTPPTTNQN